jgi:hypothetical protein
MKLQIGIALIIGMLTATPAAAGLKDIHTEKLPEDKAILRIYSDVGEVEGLVKEWHDKWDFDTPKSKVVDLLRTSLTQLQKAADSYPGNEELLLLTGLIAHYAYNVDINGSHDVATDALAKAHKLAPVDYRPEWFLGAFDCQTLETVRGMKRFLSIEREMQWNQMSPGFWDDYLDCASVTIMPAHALRAGKYASALSAEPSSLRNFLMDTAQKRFIVTDSAKTYSAREAWQAENKDSVTIFTNAMFGIQVSSEGTWGLNIRDVQKGMSLAQFEPGPYQGKRGNLSPTILLLMRAPKEGESLNDFARSLVSKATLAPSTPLFCPTQECLAFEATSAGLYKEDGAGNAFVTVFARNCPEFPGLPFEEPLALPSGEPGKTTYSHPLEHMHRLPGTLYYFVLLDSADSILPHARIDYENFLKGIKVE